MSQHLLITADDAATMLNLSRPQIYALARENIIPTVHVGRRVMFSPTALERWVESGGSALPGGWRKEPVKAV